MIIKNAQLFHTDGTFHPGHLVITEERITAVSAGEQIFSEADTEVLDAGGCYAIPGLTDIHFHGCVGHDFCDGEQEAIEALTRYEAENGITAICPATMTFPEDVLKKICEIAAAWRADGGHEGADLVGINMEGPFINKEKKGAQNGTYIMPPDAAMFRRLQETSGGLVKLLDIAPELPGAMETIRELKDQVVISLAHTAADYDTADKAFSCGATHVTHCFNAMPPFSHRAPGVVGAALDAENSHVELITDGVHIHPGMVRATFKMFGDDRVVLISDSMMATGLPDGEYSLGGQAVKVRGNRCTLEDGTIAGSATNLMDCMRTAVRDMGIPLGSAVKCAAVNPAKVIGTFDDYGSLQAGKYANVVLLDQSLNVVHVLLKGKLIK